MLLANEITAKKKKRKQRAQELELEKNTKYEEFCEKPDGITKEVIWLESKQRL